VLVQILEAIAVNKSVIPLCQDTPRVYQRYPNARVRVAEHSSCIAFETWKEAVRDNVEPSNGGIPKKLAGHNQRIA